MDGDYITVACYREPSMAELAKSKLVAEGIECELVDEQTIAINWLWSDLLGGVKVRVPEGQAAEARMLLGDDESRRDGAIEVESAVWSAQKQAAADELYCPLDIGPGRELRPPKNLGRWLILFAMTAIAVWMARQP